MTIATKHLTINQFNYAAAVIIGRFQIFHFGHLALLNKALATGEKVVVVIGSANQARSGKNPFTWQERVQMIGACLTDEQRQRVLFVAVRDYYDMQLWEQAVQRQVHTKLQQNGLELTDQQIALVGYLKDETSEYLKQFIHWQFVAIAAAFNHNGVHKNATELRQLYFSNNIAELKLQLPLPVMRFLEQWQPSIAFSQVQQYWQRLQQLDNQTCQTTAVYLVIKTKLGYLLKCQQDDLSSGYLALPQRQSDEQDDYIELAKQLLNQLGFKASKFGKAKKFNHPQRCLAKQEKAVTYFISQVEQVEQLPSAYCWLTAEEILTNQANFINDGFNIITRTHESLF